MEEPVTSADGYEVKTWLRHFAMGLVGLNAFYGSVIQQCSKDNVFNWWYIKQE